MAGFVNFANPNNVKERAAAWLGQDGNIWANLGGNVQNMGAANNQLLNDKSGTLGVNTGDRQFLIDWINDPSPGNTNTNSSTGSSSGSSGGSSVAAAFDPSFYNALLQAIDARESRQQDDIRNAYGASINSLTGERDRALGNLDREETKLNDQRARGLDSLTNDLSKLWQSTNLQLGMFGAGNSSAARDLGMSVTDLANKESGNLNSEFNEQLGDIGQNRIDYGKQYDDKKDELQSKMNRDILNARETAENSRNDIRETIHNKTDNRALAQEQANRVLNSYNSFQAPNEALNLPEYKGAGVQNRGIGGSVAIQSPNAAQGQYYSTVAPKRDDDDK